MLYKLTPKDCRDSAYVLQINCVIIEESINPVLYNYLTVASYIFCNFFVC